MCPPGPLSLGRLSRQLHAPGGSVPYVPQVPTPPSRYGVVNASGELHRLAERLDTPDTADEARRLAATARGARPVRIVDEDGFTVVADLPELRPDGHAEPRQSDQGRKAR